jgi:hypothetical protein
MRTPTNKPHLPINPINAEAAMHDYVVAALEARVTGLWF